MKKGVLLVFLFMLLAASACMNVSLVPLGIDARGPSLDPARVKVFLSERDVPGEYKKIALIYAEEIIGFKSVAAMIHTMRVKAARAGANGIILNEINRITDFSDLESGPTNKKQIKAIAILTEN